MKQTISDQIRKALSERKMAQRELGDLLGLSLRQVQRKLRENNWSVIEVERISQNLSFPFTLGTTSDAAENMANEPDTQYDTSKLSRSPIRVTIEIDPPDGDFSQVPRFVKTLQDAFEEFQKEHLLKD